jgi:hypothetical protein
VFATHSRSGRLNAQPDPPERSGANICRRVRAALSGAPSRARDSVGAVNLNLQTV